MQRLTRRQKDFYRAVYGKRAPPDAEFDEKDFLRRTSVLSQAVCAAMRHGVGGEPAPSGADPVSPVADDSVKALYDKQAETKVSKSKRAKGPSIALKRFHNLIKRQLILRFCRRGASILDIACGRGGDLSKWVSAGARCVRGIDMSGPGIVEARKRWSILKKKRGRGGDMRVTFEQSDSVGMSPIPGLSGQYDAVTIMFALHYFFGSEAVLRTLLSSVAAALKNGGYFFGTVTDGAAVVQQLDTATTQKTTAMRLERAWTGPAADFGSAFFFKIADTVVDGGRGSREFLVFSRVLERVAAEYGLEPVRNYGRQLPKLFDSKSKDGVLKRFYPKYENEKYCAVSRMYSAFCFKMNRSKNRHGGGATRATLPEEAKT